MSLVEWKRNVEISTGSVNVEMDDHKGHKKMDANTIKMEQLYLSREIVLLHLNVREPSNTYKLH